MITKNKIAKQEVPDYNALLEGNDKAPGEERGKKEKVTNDDLKGKNVDGDPEEESGKPLETKAS